jgi:DNA polymerase III subunit beta
MKFSCPQKDLLDRLKIVNGAISPKAIYPILQNVKISADADAQTVALTGFDMRTCIVATMPCTVERSGETTAVGRGMMQTISKLTGRNLSLDLHGETLSLFAEVGRQKSNYGLQCLSAEEYHELPIVSATGGWVSAGALATGLKHAIGAASRDDTRQILTGVKIEIGSYGVTFAATDGHRLYVAEVDCDEIGGFSGEDTTSLLIPGADLDCLLSATIGLPPETIVTIQHDSISVAFHLPGYQFSFRLLDGTYPAYRQLVPTAFANSLVVDRREILEAVDRLLAIAPENTYHLTLSGGIDGSGLSMAANGKLATGAEEIDAEIIGKLDLMALNARYFLDALKTLQGTRVTMRTNGSLQPITLHGSENSRTYALLMPVRLPD